MFKWLNGIELDLTVGGLGFKSRPLHFIFFLFLFLLIRLYYFTWNAHRASRVYVSIS